LLLPLAAAAQPLSLSEDRVLTTCTLIRAESLPALARDAEARRASVEVLRGFAISHLLLEVFQPDVALEDEERVLLRDFFQGEGFDVGAFYLTAQYPDFGVEDNESPRWMNFESPKTREDVERAVRISSRHFDELMIGEYFCTADTSAESAAAKRERAWSAYRQALMLGVADDLILRPAREERPGIRVLFKMPQWYDRFPTFGYDPEALSGRVDGISVGAESRGVATPAYGHVTPYDGYFSARRASSLAGGKFSGAVWFDDNDCAEHEWIHQAWNAVLAGGRELGLFKYESLERGHVDHTKLQAQFPELEALARHLNAHPVSGIPMYMPPQGEPDSEAYAAGLLGMLGIPLQPAHTWPESGDMIFLASHAAADPNVADKARAWVERGGSLVITQRFLARAQGGDALAELAGMMPPDRISRLTADTIVSGGEKIYIRPSLRLSGQLVASGAETVLTAESLGDPFVVLTSRETENGGRIAVLNLYTFDEEDFARMYAPTYAPAPHALPAANRDWSDALRAAFLHAAPYTLSAPAGVTLFPLSGTGYFLQNHSGEPADITMTFADGPHEWNGQRGESLAFSIPAHSRVWVKKVE
jgi:hypothetical protein